MALGRPGRPAPAVESRRFRHPAGIGCETVDASTTLKLDDDTPFYCYLAGFFVVALNVHHDLGLLGTAHPWVPPVRPADGTRSVPATGPLARLLVALRVVGVAAVWAALAPGSVLGQTPRDDTPPRSAPTTEPSPRTPSGGAVEESPLETYYLKDSNGKLVPFFEALPFEEFERLYRLYEELEASQEPRPYSIQSLSASGTADDTEARLTVTINVRILREGWARLPLRMNRLLLLHAVSHTGEGKQFTNFDREGDGYTCWIHAAADTEHELTFEGIVPLESSAGTARLALRLPQATTSQMQLTVPAADAEVTPSVGANLRPVERLDDGHTRFTVLGVGGDFQLAWRARRAEQAAVAPVLEADATIRASFEGTRHVSSDARLKVRNYGGPLESFVVRLPAGMELTPSDQVLNQDRYTLRVREEDDKSKDGITPGQLVEVRLRRKTTEPVEIDLRARLAGGTNQPGNAVELAGFEVLGAERQWGHIDVAVEGDLLLDPEVSDGVHRVGGFVDPLSQGNVVARFEYERQPCSLKVRLVPRETRVVIEPSYQLSIERDRVQLEARLKYRLSGTKTFDLNVRPMGWVIDSVVPENALPAASDEGDEAPLTIFLAPMAQPSSGQAEVRITAHRPLDAGMDKLVLPLPKIEGGTVTPGRVVVLAGDNIELSPLASEMRGLAVETANVAVEGPPRQQPPLVYRQLGGQEETAFASRLTVREREVAASMATALTFDAESVQVEQRLSYRVAYEALARLELSVPRELVGLKGFTVTLGDREVSLVIAESASAVPESPSDATRRSDTSSPTAPSPETDGLETDGPRRRDAPSPKAPQPQTNPTSRTESSAKNGSSISAGASTGSGPSTTGPGHPDQVESTAVTAADTPTTPAVGRLELPGGRIGRFELVVRYTLPLPTWEPQEETRFDVPLVMPVVNSKTSLAGNTLSLTTSDALEAAAPGSPWTMVDDGGAGTHPAQIRVTAPQVVSAVSIALKLTRSDDRASTVVRQAWVQTWMASSDRRDRAVFRLTTTGDMVVIQLPPGVSSEPGDIDVLLDGHTAPGVTVTPPGQVTIDLAGATALNNSEHVVELWYFYREGRPPQGSFQVAIPQVSGTHGPHELYWQLALPADELLVRGPGGLAEDLTWHWQQILWTRRARLDQRDLERWINAGHVSPLPESSNQYLFSGFGSVATVKVMTAGRRMLLLVISAATLVAGLALVHLRIARHPAVLTTVGVALAALALVFPSLAIQAAQPAGLALAFLAVVALVTWGVGRRRVRRAVVRGSSYAALETSSTQSAIVRPPGGSTKSGRSRAMAASDSLP